jgi:glycosyltransferase involved in cell wall biosynthesis
VRGTPLAVRALVQALLSQGHAVDLLTFPQGQDAGVPGLRHRRSLWLPVGRVRPGASLAKLVLDVPFLVEAGWRLATGSYDVVHAVEEAAHAIAPLARLLGKPLVMDVDSSIPDQLRYSGFAARGPLPWLAERMERHALRQAAVVVTVCDSLSEGVRRRAPEAHVHQIEDPPLVSADDLPPAESLAALRAELGLDDSPIVLYSGNFEAYQGVELLLDAWGEGVAAQLVLMGGEPGEIARLQARVGERGLETRCRFAGKRPPSQLPAFLALADLLVSPRVKGENTPFKVYTFLASGRPLVATRIPSHTQLLDDSLAWLVEPNAPALAAGITRALDDPETSQQKARAGRALIEREYSQARFEEKVAAAYEDVARAIAGG